MSRCSQRFCWLFCILAVVLVFARSSAAQEIRFLLERSPGPVFTFNASAQVSATSQQVWQVLTDYNRLATFVPDMKSSRLVERTEQNGVPVAVVEQVGQIGIAFFTRDIRLTLRVTEHAPDADGMALIDMVQVEGKDMKRFSARYVIERLPVNGVVKTLLRYEATIEPEFFVPPLIGTALMRSKGRQQFVAVVKEIERVARVERVSGSMKPQ